MAEQDNALAGQAATRSDVIDLGSLQLIGVINAHDGLTALLRSSGGEFARVQVGDSAFGVQVLAIDDAQVMVRNRWGQNEAVPLVTG